MSRMPRCSFITVALSAVVVGAVAPAATLRAQLTDHSAHAPAPSLATGLSARDSLRILGQAHDAQLHFEVYRRQELPRTAPSDVPACETTVGRMCYWSEPEHSKPIPEPGSITRARAKLIAKLSQLAERSRADEWIAGQRVRYMVENGDDSAAVVAARECWAAKWWCGVLLGFALHAEGHYDLAESAFDSALAVMPRDVRCRWTDISLLLEDDRRDAYRKLPCEARDSLDRRYWALAQPSYIVRGNDRRTEHFSRELLAELSKDAENAYGMKWGDDLRELLIRYGEPMWYATTWPDPGMPGAQPSPMGHDREPAYHFAAIRGSGDSVHWDVRLKPARERYSPPYIDSIVDLDAQFAMLKRGDSALVVAVYADSNWSAHTVLGVSADAPVARVAGDTTTAVRVRRARAAWRGIVAGVEWYDPTNKRDSRARTWLAPPVAPPGAPELSTLVLFAGDTAGSVSTLDEALDHALTANELRGNDRLLGLYWEVYGTARGAVHAPARPTTPRDSVVKDSAATDSIARDSTQRDTGQVAVDFAVQNDSMTPAGIDTVRRDSTRRDSVHTDTVQVDLTHVDSTGVAEARVVAPGDTLAAAGSDVSITVTQLDGGIFSRLGRALHIIPRSSPLAMQWHDGQISQGIASRSVVLNLAQLPPGKYRITLAAGPDDAHRTMTSREIRLR